MKHCPKCFAAYEDWATQCSDCKVDLDFGASRKPEEMTPVASFGDVSDFVSVCECESMFEAQALKNVLVTEGILHIMVIPHGGASSDALKIQSSWWDLRVSEGDKVRAKLIIEEARRDLASSPPKPSDLGEEDPEVTPVLKT